jgi:hypothetical protein
LLLILTASLKLETTMAKHHPDLVMCRKQPGIAIGRLCEKCKSFRGVLIFLSRNFLLLFGSGGGGRGRGCPH